MAERPDAGRGADPGQPDRREPRRGRRAERGSALMLLPAGVLIVMVLGSIAVDFGLVFLAERELVSAAAAAANDAATAALDEHHFRETGEIRLDPGAAERVAHAAIAARAGAFDLTDTVVIVHPDLRVEVRLAASVHHLFSPVIPGVAHDTQVEAVATAEPRVR